MSDKSTSVDELSLIEKPYQERKQVIVVHDGDPILLPELGEALREAQKPTLPEGLVWFQHEPMWQSVAEGRLNYGSTDFRLEVAYEDDYGINANLSQKVLLTNTGLGGKFEEYKSTLWRMEGEYGQ